MIAGPPLALLPNSVSVITEEPIFRHCREMWLGQWRSSIERLSWIHGRKHVRSANLLLRAYTGYQFG
jgi:hypothetical protein